MSRGFGQKAREETWNAEPSIYVLCIQRKKFMEIHHLVYILFFVFLFNGVSLNPGCKWVIVASTKYANPKATQIC
jgi:hypothetical protein